MKTSFYYYMTQSAGLSAVVGTRIYRSLAPSGSTKPYIVFSYEGAQALYNQSGRSEYFKRTVNIECVGSTPDSCDSVAEAFKTFMDFQNLVIGDTGDKAQVFATTFLSEFDNFDLVDSSQSPDFIINQSYEISYKEA